MIHGLHYALIAYRILNSLCVTTYFHPDEYWQSLEVAHYVVFGKGYLTWEWTNDRKIRGWGHPLMIAAGYKTLQVLGWDSRWMVAYGPKVWQAVLVGIGDYLLYRLATKQFGEHRASWVLFAHLVSWFQFYCGTRTFANSIEAVLATAALYFWTPTWYEGYRNDDDGYEFREVIAYVLATICIIIRPTSVIIWTYVGLYRLATARYGHLRICLRAVLIVGGLYTLSVLLDSWMYGEWTVTIWNFLRFNLFMGKNRIFGVHSWHWYLSQGLPAVLGASLPFFIHGIWITTGKERHYLGVIVAYIALHSISAHKEFRFLEGILPLCSIYCGLSMHRIRSILSSYQRNTIKVAYCFLFAAIFLVNLLAAIYLSTRHQVWYKIVWILHALRSTMDQRGTITALDSLARIIQRRNEPLPQFGTHIFFLMPCHSAPYYSHMHLRQRVEMEFLDCNPLSSERSASAQFLSDPERWMKENPTISDTSSLPIYIIIYDYHYNILREHLDHLGYNVMDVFFHADINGDSDHDVTYHSVLLLEQGS